jgi:hypothetical protein
MNRQATIQKTMEMISALPDEKIEEISDFAAYVLKKYDDQILRQGMYTLAEQSDAFNFVNEDEEIYTINDLKERFK